jgi:hypothetical protein
MRDTNLPQSSPNPKAGVSHLRLARSYSLLKGVASRSTTGSAVGTASPIVCPRSSGATPMSLATCPSFALWLATTV